MTLLPSLLLVLVAGCHAQLAMFPALTYPLPLQPRLHYVPLVPYYYQPLIQPQVYTTSVETSGTERKSQLHSYSHCSAVSENKCCIFVKLYFDDDFV